MEGGGKSSISELPYACLSLSKVLMHMAFSLSGGQCSSIGFCAEPPAFALIPDLTAFEARFLPQNILYEMLTTPIPATCFGRAPLAQPNFWPILAC